MQNKSYQAWKVDSSFFTTKGSPEDKIKFLINYAILAPSSHNSQPWCFKIGEDFVDLHADFKRKLKYSDQESRMLYISLGCALTNIKVAADYFSIDYGIEYAKDMNNFSNHVARINFKKDSQPLNERLRHLFPAITKRHSNRSEYEAKPVPEEYLQEFKNYNKNSNIRLDLIFENNMRGKLAKISSEAMRKVMADQNFRRELAGWLRNNLTRKKDGMPGNGHNMSLITSFLAPFILRHIDVSKVEAEKELKRILNLPVIGIISSGSNNPTAWLKVGELFEKILLAIEIKGLSSIIRVASIEVPEAREKLKKVLDIDFTPQMFFGLGYTKKDAPYSPRRGIEEVLC